MSHSEYISNIYKGRPFVFFVVEILLHVFAITIFL